MLVVLVAVGGADRRARFLKRDQPRIAGDIVHLIISQRSNCHIIGERHQVSAANADGDISGFWRSFRLHALGYVEGVTA